MIHSQSRVPFLLNRVSVQPQFETRFIRSCLFKTKQKSLTHGQGSRPWSSCCKTNVKNLSAPRWFLQTVLANPARSIWGSEPRCYSCVHYLQTGLLQFSVLWSGPCLSLSSPVGLNAAARLLALCSVDCWYCAIKINLTFMLDLSSQW